MKERCGSLLLRTCALPFHCPSACSSGTQQLSFTRGELEQGHRGENEVSQDKCGQLMVHEELGEGWMMSG